MILVFLGKQFVGKGTYAQNASKKFGFCHLIMGALIKNEIRAKSEIGKRIEQIVNSGHYVDDDTVIALLEKKLDEVDLEKGVVFDGYPRTKGQAQALDAMLAKKGAKVELAINFTGDEQTLMARATGRRTCPQCGTVYHLVTNPPKNEGKCDRCGTGLVQRKDDTPDIIKQRFAEHEQKTKPVLDYYREKGTLLEIDGARPIPAVNADVEKTLSEKFGITPQDA